MKTMCLSPWCQCRCGWLGLDYCLYDGYLKLVMAEMSIDGVYMSYMDIDMVVEW